MPPSAECCIDEYGVLAIGYEQGIKRFVSEDGYMSHSVKFSVPGGGDVAARACARVRFSSQVATSHSSK